MEPKTLVETGIPSELIPTEENAIILRSCGVDPQSAGNLNEPLCQGSPDSVGTARDWDSERMNAHGLLHFFCAEYLDEDAKQRSILKRWPQAPRSVSTSNSERCIPEAVLRDNDEDSLRFLKTFVRRSVRKLRGDGEDDDSVYDGQRDVVEALAKLSDEGVIEALPNLIGRVKLKTLVVINNILQGDETVVRNLEYLIGRIKYLIHDIHSGQPGQRGKPLTKRLQDIVAILRCRDSYKKVLRRKLQLEGSSPVEVAESALLQVDDFPACHLNAMLRTIKKRLPGEVGRAERFAEKARLTRSIQKTGYDLLATCGGPKLPEDLRKCLIVMSLSARHIYGNDGSLIDFLSPISIEKRSLHRIILAALSNLKYLTVENLRLLFQDLGPRYVRPYKRITPKIMRCAAKAIFLDCLLYSELRPVPECVRTAAENLKGEMRIIRAH